MEHAFYQGNVSRLFAVFDSPQQQEWHNHMYIDLYNDFLVLFYLH